VGLSRGQARVTDGMPEDIWIVNADGSDLRRLAALAEDLPSFAWSADGKRLFSIGGQGLWQMDVASGKRDKLSEGVFHGQIAWVTPAR
jgi:hypothetical protein